MARKLNHPEMPALAYKYDIRLIGKLPDEIWALAKRMDRLWNLFVACCDVVGAAYAKDKNNPARKELYKELLHFGAGGGLYELTKTYRGSMPNECYWSVYDKFMKAQRRFASGKGGAPNQKFGLRRILLPCPLGNGGLSADWLHEDTGRVYVKAPRGAPFTRGHFTVGGVTIFFETVMDRPLPDGALIKSVALSGVHERPFGWKWALIVSLQVPPHSHLPRTGRVAGLDLGWRNMGDGIRIGVLADNAGDLWELRLPYDLTRARDRKFIARLREQNLGDDSPLARDPRVAQEMQSEMDARLEDCKVDLAGVDRSAWPDKARAAMAGIVKMRAGGLRRVRRELQEAGISYEFLEEWEWWYETDLRRLRAAQIDWIRSRNYLYRLIAVWIADNLDVLGWEELNLKAMAEEAKKRKEARKQLHAQTGEWEERTVRERILEASQKRRQWAALHILRGYIREAMAKRGRDLQDHPAAYSTQICNECGLRILPGAELLLTCEARHTQDQDVNAARRFLTLVNGKARAVAASSASVNHSQLLRVIRPVNTAITAVI